MNKNFFERIIKKLKSKSNNEGASIVLVVVTIAFVGMLVAMSAYMSYYNHMMKMTDKQAKKNFYSAEEALAIINAGLQTVVSNSMAVAYNYAIQGNPSVDINVRNANFQVEYEKRLIEALALQNDEMHYDIEILKDYLENAGWNYNPSTGVGAQILTTPNTGTQQGENTIFKKEGGIVLQNVELMYTDENGYITMLTTDIRLRLPEVSLVSNSGVPELENCSIIANDNLNIESNNNIRVSGNVYGGKDGLNVTNDSRLSFEKKDDADNLLYRLVAGKVTVENSVASSGDALTVTEDYELWTEAVDVISGRIALEGSAFVKDDLTVSGRNSSITLAGNYYGYGDELYKSTNSSAIVVNGANTSLDFSNLTNLMLAGHAYIGARHYDANNVADDYIPVLDEENESEEDSNEEQEDDNQSTENEDEIAKNEKDLMMGESVGVKSNQLMYMVPTECMGYYYGTTEQVLAKNPITYDEYLTLTQTYQYERTQDGQIVMENGQPKYKLDEAGNKIPQYSEVNLNVIAKKINKSIGSIGATYKPVFRRINGTVLVYYYLDFTSDKAANDFFAEYYAADKENMDSYIKMYINEFAVNPALSASQSNLHLAGNMIKYEADGTISLVDDTATQDALVYDQLAEKREQWNDSFTAYSKKMLSSTNLMTDEQLTNDIFDNIIVDNATFSSIVPSGQVHTFTSGATKALVINNADDTTPYSVEFSHVEGVSLIIATGDLILNTNFEGLVIAGGTIQLGSSCNRVVSDPIGVRQAMFAKNSSDYQVSELLLDGSAYIAVSDAETGTGGITTEEQQVQRDNDYVDISELVIYENWTKQ